MPSNTSSPRSWVISCITSRAVVDLPQPDSPTTPRVSPFFTSKSTPSTARTALPPRLRDSGSRFSGKCLTSPRTLSSGWAGPPTSPWAARTVSISALIP
ncbi:hypothetical protein G6F57_021920 [Rhizopus arrhizus]|nr:hypothetical protein G6F57_021920 [Rhizopus arrhizus]